MIALATEEYDSTQRESSEEEMGLNEPYDSPKIVKQSALDHFNFVLKEAQRVVAQAENERPQKCPKDIMASQREHWSDTRTTGINLHSRVSSLYLSLWHTQRKPSGRRHA